MNVSTKHTRSLIAIVLLAAAMLSACSFAGVGTDDPDGRTSGRSGDLRRASYGEPRSLTVRLAADADIATIEAQLNAAVVDVVSVGDSRYARIEVPAESAEQAVLLAQSLPSIHAAQRTIIYDHFLTPNDDSYDLQYAPQLTNLGSVWAELDDSADPVVVAVVDSGVNTTHQDMVGRIVAGRDTIANAPYDVGANLDDDGHGTHVAGIIAATGNNSVGIAGVTWHADIMPIRALGVDGGSDINVAEGVVWAVNNEADIINMSLGGVGASIVLADAINYALENNVTVIAAAGNDGRDQINYPAAFPGVIAVGSTNSRDEVSSFSTRGEHLSVSAPGEDIWSLDTFNNNGYLTLDGTSMAAPFVSGVAALLMQKHGTDLTPGQIRGMLEATAVDLGAAGYDDAYGHGRVDPVAAFAADPTAFSTSYGGTIEVNAVSGTAPLAGQTVMLLSGDGSTVLSAAITSDGATPIASDGRALFRGLDPAGTYQVRSTLLGEQSSATVVSPSVTSVTPVTLNFPTIRPILVDTQWVRDRGPERDFESPETDGLDFVHVTVVLLDVSRNIVATASFDPNFTSDLPDFIYPSITGNLFEDRTYYVVLTDVADVPAALASGNLALVVSTDTTRPLVPLNVPGRPQPSVFGLTSFANAEALTVASTTANPTFPPVRYLRKTGGNDVYFSFVVPTTTTTP